MNTTGPAALLLMVVLAPPSDRQPWPRHTIDDSSRGADGVRLADVNGDGRLDVATGWEEGGVVRAYLHPGPRAAAQRWPAVTVGRARSVEDAVFVDLDADGAVDVVSCCQGGNRTVYFHWAPRNARQCENPKAWRTEPVRCTAHRQWWMFALPLQVDGRFGTDLIVGSKGSGASISWLQSPADARDATGWTLHPLYEAGWIMSLQAHDLDGDGDLDILASDRKGPRRGVLWLENPGTGGAVTSRWNEHRIGGEGSQVMFLAVGDLDHDGHRDIVCAVKGQALLRLEQRAGPLDQWETSRIALPPGCGTGKGIAMGDIDGDGRCDVVFSCEGAAGGRSGVRWLSFDRSPDETVWRDHEISGAAGVKFDRIELLDIEADGDLDVLACEERDNLGVFWYENPHR